MTQYIPVVQDTRFWVLELLTLENWMWQGPLELPPSPKRVKPASMPLKKGRVSQEQVASQGHQAI